jgi:Zinc finger, C3HC4 type (RING finger)
MAAAIELRPPGGLSAGDLDLPEMQHDAHIDPVDSKQAHGADGDDFLVDIKQRDAEQKLQRHERLQRLIIPPIALFGSLIQDANPPSAGMFLPKDPTPWRPAPRSDRELVLLRNRAIWGTLFHIFSSFAGIGLNAIRRSVVTNVFNVLLMVVSVLGVYGVMRVKTYYIMAHWILTFGFNSVLALYLFLEYFLIEKNFTFLLLHLMFMLDCFVAWFTYKLYLHCADRRRVSRGDVPFNADKVQELFEPAPVNLREYRAQVARLQVQFAPDQVLPDINPARRQPRVVLGTREPLVPDDPTCVICMDREKAIRLHPCSHQELCAYCTMRLVAAGQRCPLCRSQIEWVESI